ncbi:MAG: alpha-2-macroglobulin, partial [Chitinophagaceae bacterium]|nr:alpha-2-macroglobulin [Chitinophagaceae bacterium]
MNFMSSKPLFAIALLLACHTATHSQLTQKKYEQEWKRVETLAKKNRPGSAYKEAQNIYELAKKEQQDVQAVKALVYMSGLLSENREQNKLFSIREIEKELINSPEPIRSILKSLLAEVYWGYFQEIRWKLYSRSKTENYKSYDPDTWNADDFHHKIGELYQTSLQNEKILQSASLDIYDPILVKGNARVLRPTLFDLLAHRAFEYFRNDERDITKPGYALDLDLATAFAPAEEFTLRILNSQDSITEQHPALVILRKLLLFHLTDENPAALIDADIKRIEFVNSRSIHPNVSQFYYSALERIVNAYENHPAAAQAWYLMAKVHERSASLWKPFGDTAHRYDKVKAKDICEKVLYQQRVSEGSVNCENLLNTMSQRSIQFSIEKVTSPNQPFRALAEYINTPVIYLRIIKYDDALENKLQYQNTQKTVAVAPPLKEWQQALPSSEDMQPHSAEIKIDGLPSGNYMLLAATEKDFTKKETVVATTNFHVSGISYINNGNDYFVLDRESGQPLANAHVQIWEKKHNYNTQVTLKEKGNEYYTDSNGHFKMALVSAELKNYQNNPFLLDITYKNDRLFMDDNGRPLYMRSSRKEADRYQPVTNLFLFTDRSIYRPGQLLYFKGIVFSKDSTARNGAVLKDHDVTVYLRDANQQLIDSLAFTTNEFGSFSGKFQLPSSSMNGKFSLHTLHNYGTTYISVEDYKRPKFAAEFEPVKGSYKINDTIRITGIAKAYAGNNIDGATVKYRVIRKTRFFYDWYFWHSSKPQSREAEIISGELKTDDAGKFIISFKALPDPEINKNTEPVFDYRVYADITDINGETRSAEQEVSVSYKSLLIRATMADAIPTDSLRLLHLRTENMNGEFEPASLTVSFTRLKDEMRLIRRRFWDRPDQFVMTKEEFLRNFPYDEYDNEANPKNRVPDKLVFQQTGPSAENSKWPLIISPDKLLPGFYKVSISTKDNEGNTVTELRHIELYDNNSKQLSNPAYWWIAKANNIEPGQTTAAILGSSAEQVYIIQQVSKGTAYLKPRTDTYSFHQLNNGKISIPFSADENDRGGYGISWIFVKHNRVYQDEQIIDVSWENKELQIEYTTFRDKTLPGAEEKWSLKITGHKKEKAAAELLASMYDASLDQILPHRWGTIYPWYNYYRNNSWTTGFNFNSKAAYPLEHPEPVTKEFTVQYDILLSTYIFSPEYSYRRKSEPLWWLNPLDYVNSEIRNPRLMRLPKPILPDSDGDGVIDQYDQEQTPPGCPVDERGIRLDSDADGIPDCEDTDNKQPEESKVKVRTNFNETAFFFPALRTDSTGTIEFSFTMPESLTQWKFQALAHTEDLSFGYSQKKIITQKKLMVQPNAPRFVREKDKMIFSPKIVNLSDKPMKGEAVLQLLEAGTEIKFDSLFKNKTAKQVFTILPGKSIAVKFPLDIPVSFNRLLTWRIICKTSAGPGENFSDGEENTLPVLPNRTLVTETMPLWVNNTGTKQFSFTSLLNAGASKTLQNHSLTIEYTSNPAWIAIQSLPYLMEYPYECAEQTWNRFYSNALAAAILQSSPGIKQVFEKWNTKDTNSFISNLQKNEELKSLLLEETPWVLQAKTEAAKKRNIALLFDLLRMNKELTKAWDKLSQLQTGKGGFAWFKGGPDDEYITQYIITGIGHLKKLNAWPANQNGNMDRILSPAIHYLDKRIKDEYNERKEDKKEMAGYVPGYNDIQYLYMRSFFPDVSIKNVAETAYDYLLERVQKTWPQQNRYMQGMTALILSRKRISNIANDILISLKERAIKNEEMGMYWKEEEAGWFWYQAPIETQALLIEAFQEVGKDTKTVDDLRTWLLKNKQTNNWKTTKATAEACYALLLQGTEWLSSEPVVEIKLGNTTIKSTDAGQEAGTGYFKKTIEGTKVAPQMGNISVTVSNPVNLSTNKPITSASWGGVYWQYFEDLDKITTATTPLKLSKKLFAEKNTDRGPVITPVNDGDVIKIGDKIKVRVELRVDRDMEYVHMKDMRASALEPV